MAIFDPTTFIIKGKKISRGEADFLKSINFQWCPRCKAAKTNKEFYSMGIGIPCIACNSKIKKEKLSLLRQQKPCRQPLTESEKKQKQREYSRKWFLKNKRKKNQQNKNWYYANKEKTKERNKRNKEKNKHKPELKIKNALRQRIRTALIYSKKSQKTLELLGCSINFFKKHLESLWKDGMNWENYGNPHKNHNNCWHIDHIKPCASFDLTDPEQQKLCFHYSNLQPLWGKENLQKGKKVLT